MDNNQINNYTFTVDESNAVPIAITDDGVLSIADLIYLYYLTTFQVGLHNVGKFNPYTGKNFTLDDVFNFIGLDDPDVCHKTWKLFQADQPNDYLGDDVFKVAEKYDLKIVGRNDSMYLKRLFKKS